MLAKRAFLFGADSLDRLARALIEDLGLEDNSNRAQGLERTQ